MTLADLTFRSVLRCIVLILALLTIAAKAQITPSADAYTNTADPTTNYGASVLLNVGGATQTTYIQFDLSSIPSGASVSQATLKLYVDGVATAGSFQRGLCQRRVDGEHNYRQPRTRPRYHDCRQRAARQDEYKPVRPHRHHAGSGGMAERNPDQRRNRAGG